MKFLAKEAILLSNTKVYAKKTCATKSIVYLVEIVFSQNQVDFNEVVL